MLKELWRNIDGYKELYQVSNLGNVRSFKYNTSRILKERINRRGYCYINLCQNGKYKSCSIHRLVAIAFLGKSDLTVNHKDGDKENNLLENLEWLTHKENLNHAKENGLIKIFGEDNPNSKLTEDNVREIRKLYQEKKTKVRSLSFKYNVSKYAIRQIINGNSWKHVK